MKKFSGFYKKSIEERIKDIIDFTGIEEKEFDILKNEGTLPLKTADMMTENVIGTFSLPYSVATNFVINGEERLIPMVIEETSVVAAASHAAKLSEGFQADSDEPVMIGQIQLMDVSDFEKAKENIIQNKEKIKELCNNKDSMLIKFGGGFRDVEVNERENMLIVHLLIDVRDAMGANAVNTMSEAVAPLLEEITGGRAKLRIITNLAEKRLARAKAVWKKEKIGEKTIDGIIEAYEFARKDRYRCATHNKGIMNGIDAAVISTGNDWRAVEAGAHSYASIDGYSSLTHYEKTEDGDLVGTIEIPLALGTIGGAIKMNPVSQLSLKILGLKTSKELAETIASLGLAQNFAALRALSGEGIQKGHMKLHAKNLAFSAGARGEMIDEIAEKMIKEDNISESRARELIEK